MYRSVTLAVFAALLLAAPAQAAISQQAIVNVVPAVGTGSAVGKQYVGIQAYLSTRDPASTRASHKPNPVGTVLMTFPTGSVATPNKSVVCKLSGTTYPGKLATSCPKAQIGNGWALMSNLGVNPLAQVSGAPKPCDVLDTGQYSRTYPVGKPACTPLGFVWVNVKAYQGATIKGVQHNEAITFANDNKVMALSFTGLVVGNKLTVTLPSLGGKGSQAGELPLGIVLTDFRLNITNTTYLKAGACPSSKKFVVSTKTVYSKFVSESTPAPAPITVATSSPCK